MAHGAVALDIRDKEEHDADLNTTVLCCCNAVNRGTLSAGGLKAYRALA